MSIGAPCRFNHADLKLRNPYRLSRVKIQVHIRISPAMFHQALLSSVSLVPLSHEEPLKSEASACYVPKRIEDLRGQSVRDFNQPVED